jgi:hypothetical protein
VARKYLEFSISIKNMIKIIFSSLIMGAVVYFMQPITYAYIENWNIILLIPLGAFTYGIMLIITRTIDKNIIKLLLNK